MVQQVYNQVMEDAIHLNMYQKTNDKTNTISENSRNFADAVEAKIISLVRQGNEMLVAA